MRTKPLSKRLTLYLLKHQLDKKFQKQVRIFLDNPRHPSLHTELLEPTSEGIYSFRLDIKYRVIFIFLNSEEMEIIDINDHYQ